MFELNLNKRIINRKIKDSEVILGEIIPSPFFVERMKKEVDVFTAETSRVKVIQSFYERCGYVQLSNELMQYISKYANSITTIKLISFIATKLKFNSNKIVINPTTEEVKAICKDTTHFYRYIDKLKEQKIIDRTTRQHVYVVNHDMIFKGSYSDFVKVYIDMYKEILDNPPKDDKNRIVLDKGIDYGK